MRPVPRVTSVAGDLKSWLRGTSHKPRRVSTMVSLSRAQVLPVFRWRQLHERRPMPDGVPNVSGASRCLHVSIRVALSSMISLPRRVDRPSSWERHGRMPQSPEGPRRITFCARVAGFPSSSTLKLCWKPRKDGWFMDGGGRWCVRTPNQAALKAQYATCQSACQPCQPCQPWKER